MARVLLLFGGRSAEHEVSCESAAAVHGALTEAGHRVVPVGIDRGGDWFLADATSSSFRAEGRSVAFSTPAGALRIGTDEIGFDVAFPVLHGPKGEDGTIQGMFEMAGIPYVGCGVLASALAMDKDLTKQVVAAGGVPTADWRVVARQAWEDEPGAVVDRLARSFAYPVFVKPASQGSSIGISKVGSDEGMKEAIADAFRYDDKVLVEKGIDGREIEVAVLDGPRVSLPGEVMTGGEWYTYDAKYSDQASEFSAPADLSPEDISTVQRHASRVFDVIGLEGLARIDFFREHSTGRFLFNEANTMPGFTAISGFPKMWLASGMSYPELCDHLVAQAIDRHERRSRLAVR